MVVKVGMVGVCFPSEPYRLDGRDRPLAPEHDCEISEAVSLRMLGYVRGEGELLRLGTVLELVARVCGVLACPLHFRYEAAITALTGDLDPTACLRDLAAKLRRAVTGEPEPVFAPGEQEYVRPVWEFEAGGVHFTYDDRRTPCFIELQPQLLRLLGCFTDARSSKVTFGYDDLRPAWDEDTACGDESTIRTALCRLRQQLRIACESCGTAQDEPQWPILVAKKGAWKFALPRNS
jgi:hypothetical protein